MRGFDVVMLSVALVASLFIENIVACAVVIAVQVYFLYQNACINATIRQKAVRDLLRQSARVLENRVWLKKWFCYLLIGVTTEELLVGREYVIAISFILVMFSFVLRLTELKNKLTREFNDEGE